METDIIVQSFQLAEQMHGVRYLWFIGDGDSSVYHAVVSNVSYGHYVQKVECANHVVKCYQNRLEALCKEHPQCRGCHGLSEAKMKRITYGARCAIKMHSITGDVAALRHDHGMVYGIILEITQNVTLYIAKVHIQTQVTITLYNKYVCVCIPLHMYRFINSFSITSKFLS